MADLEDLDGWQREVFAAGCAQRIQPLVDACGSAESAALYARGLRMAWNGTAGEERAKLIGDLWSVPEMAAESSDERAYYAMIPINMLATVLDGDEDGTDIAGMGSSQSLNTLGDVDYVLLSPEEEQEWAKSSGSSPAYGPLTSAEAEAEAASIAVLRAATSREQAVDALFPEAERRAVGVAEAMPAFRARNPVFLGDRSAPEPLSDQAPLVIGGRPVEVGDLLHVSSGSARATVARVSSDWVSLVWPWRSVDPESVHQGDSIVAFPRRPDDEEWTAMPWRTDPPPERLAAGEECLLFMPEADVRVVDVQNYDPPYDTGSLPRPRWSLAVSPLGDTHSVYQFGWETVDPVTFTRIDEGR